MKNYFLLIIAIVLIFSCSDSSERNQNDLDAAAIEEVVDNSNESAATEIGTYNQSNQIEKNTELLNKSNREVIKDVSVWDAFVDGYLKTIIKFVVIFLAIFLLFIIFKFVLKGFRSLRGTSSIENRIKIKEIIINFFNQMDSKDIVVFALVFGSIIGLILGYSFGETEYYFRNGRRTTVETEHTYSKFYYNYILAITSFIISGGISYLILNRKTKTKFKKNGSS